MMKEIQVPEIGENVDSGVVVAVHIKAGDTVAVDDTVIELETDKALVEIPSPFDGQVAEVLATAGLQMKVGDVIARVETEAGDSTTEKTTAQAGMPSETVPAKASAESRPGEAVDLPDAPPETIDAQAPPPSEEPPKVSDETAPEADRQPAPAAPSIRRLARELGVDIHAIQGGGPGGRISEADVKSHVRSQLAQSSHLPGATAQPAQLPDFGRWGPIETQAMPTVRRLTAQSTAASWAAVPHVTQFDEADVSDVMAFIEQKRPPLQKVGIKLTISAILVAICAQALKRFPRFNASIDTVNQRIIYKKYVHIGMAADTSRGLLVPVIRDADRMTIVELAQAITDLAERSRDKKIKPDEMEGGTFTISNQGGIGGVGFTPIVFWPQVAILGVSRSTVRPCYLGDHIQPRTCLPLALSYDHRIIDGADAARFLRWICDGLEQPLHLFFNSYPGVQPG